MQTSTVYAAWLIPSRKDGEDINDLDKLLISEFLADHPQIYIDTETNKAENLEHEDYNFDFILKPLISCVSFSPDTEAEEVVDYVAGLVNPDLNTDADSDYDPDSDSEPS